MASTALCLRQGRYFICCLFDSYHNYNAAAESPCRQDVVTMRQTPNPNSEYTVDHSAVLQQMPLLVSSGGPGRCFFEGEANHLPRRVLMRVPLQRDVDPRLRCRSQRRRAWSLIGPNLYAALGGLAAVGYSGLQRAIARHRHAFALGRVLPRKIQWPSSALQPGQAQPHRAFSVCAGSWLVPNRGAEWRPVLGEPVPERSQAELKREGGLLHLALCLALQPWPTGGPPLTL